MLDLAQSSQDWIESPRAVPQSRSVRTGLRPGTFQIMPHPPKQKKPAPSKKVTTPAAKQPTVPKAPAKAKAPAAPAAKTAKPREAAPEARKPKKPSAPAAA